jgi:hypothetical protein
MISTGFSFASSIKTKAMENVPIYIAAVFIFTTFLAVFIFFRAAHHSKFAIVVIVAWLLLQTIVSLTGFYTATNAVPPRFILLVLPPLLFIIGLFVTKHGRQFLDELDPKALLLLHTVRIPVELVLLMLFVNKAVPQIMTFEGRNLDIISGISAPVLYYFCFVKRSAGKKLLLFWNLVCLLLLINIVVIAVLSAPFAFQRFAFDQPNVAILYFPFVWLPCCVVPLVLLSHLAAIRQLLRVKQYSPSAIS